MGCFIKRTQKKPRHWDERPCYSVVPPILQLKAAVNQILSTTAISLSLFQMLPVYPLNLTLWEYLNALKGITALIRRTLAGIDFFPFRLLLPADPRYFLSCGFSPSAALFKALRKSYLYRSSHVALLFYIINVNFCL